MPAFALEDDKAELHSPMRTETIMRAFALQDDKAGLQSHMMKRCILCKSFSGFREDNAGFCTST
jgi:hypothetical protein